MVEPVTIVTLTIMAILAVNSTGLSLSYLIPYLCRKISAAGTDFVEISVHKPVDYATNILITIYWETINQKQKDRIPIILTHQGEDMEFWLPKAGKCLKYRDLFKLYVVFDDHGIAQKLKLIWDTDNDTEVSDFLRSFRPEPDPKTVKNE